MISEPTSAATRGRASATVHVSCAFSPYRTSGPPGFVRSAPAASTTIPEETFRSLAWNVIASVGSFTRRRTSSALSTRSDEVGGEVQVVVLGGHRRGEELLVPAHHQALALAAAAPHVRDLAPALERDQGRALLVLHGLTHHVRVGGGRGRRHRARGDGRADDGGSRSDAERRGRGDAASGRAARGPENRGGARERSGRERRERTRGGALHGGGRKGEGGASETPKRHETVDVDAPDELSVASIDARSARTPREFDGGGCVGGAPLTSSSPTTTSRGAPRAPRAVGSRRDDADVGAPPAPRLAPRDDPRSRARRGVHRGVCVVGCRRIRSRAPPATPAADPGPPGARSVPRRRRAAMTRATPASSLGPRTVPARSTPPHPRARCSTRSSRWSG